MPYSTINGSNAYTGYGLWAQPGFYGPIYIPQTRPGHNGERPILINSLHAFVTGRAMNAVVGCYIGGQYIGQSWVPSSGWAVSPHTTWFSGGGYVSRGSGYWDTLSMNTNNYYIWMVYRVYSGLNVTSSYGIVPWEWRNKSFVGGFNYIEVPTAPSAPWFTSITSTAMTVNFNGPGDNGGSGVNGYLIQVANNPSFSNASTYNTNGAYRVTGLSPGTQYWVRVFAKNVLYNYYGIGSQWSATGTATTVIDPPRWVDTTLGTLMRVGTPYSDAVSATTQKQPLSYSISSGKLPDGITLNTTTGAITGTPTLSAIQSGPTYNFSIRATNAGGISTIDFSRTVVPEASTWSDNIISTEMRVALPYEDSISATGTGVEYSVGPLGPLPRPETYEVVPGVFLNRNIGIISGTPSMPGTYDVTLYATNDSAEFDPTGRVQQSFRIIVKPTGKRYTSQSENEYVQIIRRWNGLEWQDISVIRKWDGTKWALLEMQ